MDSVGIERPGPVRNLGRRLVLTSSSACGQNPSHAAIPRRFKFALRHLPAVLPGRIVVIPRYRVFTGKLKSLVNVNPPFEYWEV